MVSDGCLDLPSEGGFDDEFSAYIAEVAADNVGEVLYQDGMKSRTCCKQAPYTGRTSISTTERKLDVQFLTVMW